MFFQAVLEGGGEYCEDTITEAVKRSDFRRGSFFIKDKFIYANMIRRLNLILPLGSQNAF